MKTVRATKNIAALVVQSNDEAKGRRGSQQKGGRAMERARQLCTVGRIQILEKRSQIVAK